MATIKEYLEQIKTAIYGKDVRQAIHDGIEQCYIDARGEYKVNRPLDDEKQPTDGINGQLLRTKGDGSTEWTDFGLPTDEQTETAINAWLEDHPEATTTVQDGAISPSKLNTELYRTYKQSGSVLYFFPDLSGGGYSGNCFLVVTPTKTILFDCGPTSDWSAIRDYFYNLYNAGIFSNIDYIVISHYHYDHIENLDSILSTFPHSNCHAYIPLNPEGYSSQNVSANRANVISALTTNNVEYTEVSEETVISIDNDFASIELFNSTVEDYTYYQTECPSIYNNFSMIALFKCGNIYAMFPGDIQRDAQIRIVNTRELPRLFLYCVHHHGIQNDDYRPYLEMIDPEYSVIMTSHNRALISASSSMSGNYMTGDVGSTGFSSYAYVSNKDSGSIIDGLSIPKIGWYYSYVNLYVDNTYSGDIYDGTEEHPFTEINEAIMFVNQTSNLHYRIYVKGTHIQYGYTWLRDINVAMEIVGTKGSNDEYPSVEGVYVRNCNNIEITNCIFDGIGRETNNTCNLVYVWASRVALSNCTMNGENIVSSLSATAINIREGHMYVANCTIKNVVNGVTSYREGEITTNAVNFNTISSVCYHLLNLAVNVKGLDVLTDAAQWMMGSTDFGRPYTISKSRITSALLALNSASAVSVPFYYSPAHPACICAGKKMYDILTGAEVTP